MHVTYLLANTSVQWFIIITYLFYLCIVIKIPVDLSLRHQHWDVPITKYQMSKLHEFQETYLNWQQTHAYGKSHRLCHLALPAEEGQ